MTLPYTDDYSFINYKYSFDNESSSMIITPKKNELDLDLTDNNKKYTFKPQPSSMNIIQIIKSLFFIQDIDEIIGKYILHPNSSISMKAGNFSIISDDNGDIKINYLEDTVMDIKGIEWIKQENYIISSNGINEIYFPERDLLVLLNPQIYNFINPVLQINRRRENSKYTYFKIKYTGENINEYKDALIQGFANSEQDFQTLRDYT